MQKLIAQNLVDVVIIRKKNKNIYLRFKEDQKLYVTCNNFVSEKEISKLIDNNIAKITKMYQTILNQNTSNAFFNYLGKQYTICYMKDIKEPFLENDIIYARNQEDLKKFYEKETIRIFTSEINRLKPFFANIPEFKLKIRKMKTRWGVNNRANNTITLNSELLKKDITLLDYVIVHEICHFYEPNHSFRFWQQVAKYYPNYKEARRRLKE